MTLYTLDDDGLDGSGCVDACAQTWPPLLVETDSAPLTSGLSGAVRVITRPDGQRQVTYDDRPLYRYSGDQQPGDTNGDGSDGVWHVVSVAPVLAER